MTDDDFRDLQERCQLIEDLASHPGWEVFKDRAIAQMYVKQQRLVRGRCESFEDYKMETSWCDGLNFALEIPKRVRDELTTELANRTPPVKEDEDDDIG